MGRLWSIGKLAKVTGVPVKTIRHYSDEGLLPPSGFSEGGYRLYGEADRVRLETIRTLRGLDLDLATIRALLKKERAMRQVVQLQLEAVELGLRRLQRTRAVLKRAQGAGADDQVMDTLRRMQAVAMLDAADLEAWLGSALDRHLKGVPIDRGWRTRFYEAAFKDLPAELSDAQWDALLELSELVEDEGFGARVAQRAQGFWGQVAPGSFDGEAWMKRLNGLVVRALAAKRDGELPEGRQGRRLAGAFVRACATTFKTRPTDALARSLLARWGERDLDGERFWELVGKVRGWPGPSPQAEAFPWLVAALRARYAA